MDNIVIKETSKPIDETCRALELAIANHGFGVLHVHNIRQALANKGVEFDREVRIYDVCNPQRAKQVLEKDPSISTALPCAISVFTSDGTTKLAFIRPTVMLSLCGAPGLATVAEEMERIVGEIVEAAAA